MVKLYQVFIRPVIEFCGIVYHAMLTVTQSNAIERMQKQVFKLAFGKEKSYATICAENNYVTLEERRTVYMDKFIVKSLNNERFSNVWFPKREEVRELRNVRIYKETNARTKRFYNSPLAMMRRRANDLLQEQQQPGQRTD